MKTCKSCHIDALRFGWRNSGCPRTRTLEDLMKRLLLLTFIVFSGIPSAHAQFTFTSIDFPGGTLTTARGINNHGEIVGAYRIVPPRHALLVKDGQYIPLAPKPLSWGRTSAKPL